VLPLLIAVVVLQSAPNEAGDSAAPAAQEATAPPADTPATEGPRIWKDIAVAGSATVAIAFLKPDLRRALLRDARLSNVAENFAHPIRQVRLGTRRDDDSFWVNGVAHPGLFALEALYLKRRRYGDGKAFLFTQVHSVVWEFVVEGSAFEPSGKDLVADAAGAATALWVLRPVAARAERRIADGRGRWWDGILRWLDPVARVSKSDKAVTIRPTLGRGFGLEVAF